MQNPFDPGYYRSDDLRAMGFASVGDNVSISRDCTIIGLENITLGDNTRIDTKCSIIATGPTVFEGYNHIAAFCHFVGRGGLTFERFVGISQRVCIYTANDDYAGGYLSGPTVPVEYTNYVVAPVTIRRHAIVGTGSVVLPGVEIGIGSTVGALSLVSKSLDPWGVYAGVPARRLKDRSDALLELEEQLDAAVADAPAKAGTGTAGEA